MRKIVAMLPMAGSGIRLGVPFPKSLAPTFTKDGIVPLYKHTMNQLKNAGVEEVFGVVSAEDLLLWSGFKDFPLLPKPTRGNAIGTVKWGAQFAQDSDVLICLPDVVMMDDYQNFGFAAGQDGLRRLVDWHKAFDEGVLTAGLVTGGVETFDGLHQDDDGKFMFKDKPEDAPEGSYINAGTHHLGLGWVSLLGPAEIFTGWDDNLSWAENINASDWRTCNMSSKAYDLGTVDRYMKYMDLRKLGF